MTISPQAAVFLALLGVGVGYPLGLVFRTRFTGSRIVGTVTRHTERHATIVMKRRGRSGQAPIVYYMVGPVRYREKEAIDDLTRWQAATTRLEVGTASDSTHITHSGAVIS